MSFSGRLLDVGRRANRITKGDSDRDPLRLNNFPSESAGSKGKMMNIKNDFNLNRTYGAFMKRQVIAIPETRSQTRP